MESNYQVVTTIFGSSNETNTRFHESSEGNNQFICNLENPIQTENEFADLALSLKGFTFTNYFYNSLLTYRWRLGCQLAHRGNTQLKHIYHTYNAKEGFFDAYGFITQFTQITSQEESETPANYIYNMSELGYTVSPVPVYVDGEVDYNSSNVFCTFQRLEYNEDNGKLSAVRDAFSYLVKDTDYSLNGYIFPKYYTFEITNETLRLYHLLGIHREGDIVETFNGVKMIRIPVSYTIEKGIYEDGVLCHRINVASVNYTFLYPLILKPYEYLEIVCENVDPGTYISNQEVLSLSRTLARVPILSTFGQTQTYNPIDAVKLSIQSGLLNSIRLRVLNREGTLNMHKCPFHYELTVGKTIYDPDDPSETVDNLRFAPPVTANQARQQDPFTLPKHQKRDEISDNVLKKRPRGH